MKFLDKLRSYFIPHEGNDHAPHSLRRKSILVVVAFLLVVEGVFILEKYSAFPDSNFFALISSNVITEKTNDSRAADKLNFLTVSPILEVAARLKAEDMATKGYFAHTSPQGLSPWYWFNQVGYKYTYAGENLAINFSDSGDLVSAWLNSPTHRANILNNHFTEIGVGTAKGMYQGRETTFVVQMFGKPAQGPKPQPVAVVPVEEKPAPIVVAQAPDVVESPEQTFVAISGVETNSEVEPIEEVVVASAASPSTNVTFTQKAVVSPRGTSNMIFYLVGAFVILALGLKVFIKFEIQHPKLIGNALIVLALVVTFVLVNEHISLSLAKVL